MESVVKRKQPSQPPAPDSPARLSGLRGHQHDEDERPSREDAGYGQTIFSRPPVPLPRWLSGGKRKPRGQR
jgi:hypothetical protein